MKLLHRISRITFYTDNVGCFTKEISPHVCQRAVVIFLLKKFFYALLNMQIQIKQAQYMQQNEKTDELNNK